MMKLYLRRLRDADNLHPRSVAVVQAKTLAQGILPGPVVLGELLVDDRHPGRVSGIGRAEPASFENRQSHRVEVMLVHDRAQTVTLSVPAGN